MASLKQLHSAKGTAQTTDGTTWTTVATYTLATNATAIIETWVVGKDTTGKVATARSVQGLERISGTNTLIGTIVNLLTFAAGSNAALVTCASRLNISGNDIQFQVTGVAATTIDWMGGFDIKIN